MQKQNKLFTTFIVVIVILIVALNFSSCEDSVSPYDQLKPGRRDYVWTVDTLQIFNTYLMKMWGSSPTDVWAVGSGTVFDKQIWHYDGREWKTDGVPRGILPWCIYGFAKDDVWLGGSDGKIWHYDGNDWSESLAYSRELNYIYTAVIFYDIWGASPNDVYAIGITVDSNDVFMGLMMHYNGHKWGKINLEVEGSLFRIIKGAKTSNNYFVYNITQNPPQDSVKFFEFDGNKLKEIYYGSNGLRNGVTTINGEVIFTYNDAAYLYSNSKFNLMVQNPLPNVWNTIYGRNKKDIIWMMSDGLTHYNGSNFEYILNFENFQLNDGFIRLKDGFVFEKEVFFLTHGYKNNYIFHGVLK